MSKQSDAKAAQNYNPTPSARTCSKCAHFTSVRELAPWMVVANGKGRARLYTPELHGVERQIKCGLGGFVVKKTAVCDQFMPPL